MTVTVKNMYDPTADVAAAVATAKVEAAAAAVRSATMASTFALDDRNQLRLVIDGTVIHEVKSATLLLSIDAAADGFTAVVPVFDELSILRDDLLAPPRYPVAEVYLGGVKQFTGRLYERTCKFGSGERYRTLVGWSPIADALDSVFSPPYEHNKTTLGAFAKKVLGNFGLTVKWQAGADLPFTRVKVEREDKVGDKLFELARQRGVFVMSDADGNVVFHQPAAADPVAMFEEGQPPFDHAEMKLDGRQWFGQSVCFSTAPRGNKQATAVDDRFPVWRRTVVQAPEGSDADMKTAAEWIARKAVADGLEFSQPVPSWYVGPLPTDGLWLPNTLLRVKSPTLFLKNGFDFLIRSVEYRWDASGEARAQLELVSPTAYQVLAVQKKNKLSWKARMALAKAAATPLEKLFMDEPEE